MARATARRRFSPAALIRARSISRGVFGDSTFWRAMFFVVYGRRLLRRVMGSEPELVAVERLEPGQFVRIEAIDPSDLESRPRRRRRRRQR